MIGDDISGMAGPAGCQSLTQTPVMLSNGEDH
jgi:hypothetical protein